MEDPIHLSGPIEPWRFAKYRGDAATECAAKERSTEGGEAGTLAAALRRALDILKRLPEALDAVQAGLAEAPA